MMQPPRQAQSPPVLVVGAGPTGLVLALWLAKAGVPLRIIDRKPGPGEASRAMVAHARTLEFYRQLGIADAALAGGIRLEALHMRKNGRDFATLPLADMGRGVSPYPFLLSYPQDDHERMLVGELAKLGVAVEWDTELTTFAQDASGVRATLSRKGATEDADFAYLCGCDGASSGVRHGLGLDFAGGTYADRFYVADVAAADGFKQDGYFNLAADGFTLLLPVRSRGMQRLIGIIPRELANRQDLTFDDLRGFAEKFLGVPVGAVNWFSTYKVHHRVVPHFRVGRCFLSGDAAHVHSPAGGQGMNTGIGDAINLAWKLADVLRGRADPSLLDTYEPERLPFARSLVATTDRVFSVVGGGGFVSSVFRSAIMPLLVPLVTSFAAVRRLMFLAISQTRINYRRGPLASGRAGGVAGGDRLPWLPDGDNFAPLVSRDWQIHAYGRAPEAVKAAAEAMELPVHEFAWTDVAGRAGLRRDAVYVVRPDGHVALADASGDPYRLAAFVREWGLRFAE